MLVPKHAKLNDKEKKDLLVKHAIAVNDLPKIKINDPALDGLDANEWDIIKITRKQINSGETFFYRRVVK